MGNLPAAPAPQNLGQVVNQEWKLPKSKFLIKSRGFPRDTPCLLPGPWIVPLQQRGCPKSPQQPGSWAKALLRNY